MQSNNHAIQRMKEVQNLIKKQSFPEQDRESLRDDTDTSPI